MNELVTSPAADVKPVVEKTNITADELAARRMGERELKAKAHKAALEASVAETAPKPKAEEPKPAKGEEPKAKEPSEDVLSHVDLSTLTDEQITELAARGKSGLLKRVAELTALRRQAEEKAQSLEEFVSQKAQATLTSAPVEGNPYAKLTTPDEVTAKYQEVAEVIEWAEEVLDRAENLSSDEIAAVVDGQSLTKAQVKENLRKARKAHDKYLPAQFKELQGQESRKYQRTAFDAQARQELPWMSEEGDLKKTYERMTADPLLKKLEREVPELAPQIGYILAHAANSIHGRKSWSLDAPAKKTVNLDPPDSPATSAASSSRPADREDKHVSELSKRYLESGKQDDFIAYRTAQLTKRKKL